MTVTTTPHNLTPGQIKCWVAIADYIDENGIAPAINDLMKIFGVHSRSLIQGRVDALKQAGVVDSQPNIPRSLRLLEQPPR